MLAMSELARGDLTGFELLEELLVCVAQCLHDRQKGECRNGASAMKTAIVPRIATAVVAKPR